MFKQTSRSIRNLPEIGILQSRLISQKNRDVNYPSAKASGLVTLLSYDWLVDIPLPEEGGYSLSLSGNAPQPDFNRGIEAYVPSSHGEHAAETDMLFLAVQLNRLTPQGSALPFQVLTLFRGMRVYIVSHWEKSVYLLPEDRSFTASLKPLSIPIKGKRSSMHVFSLVCLVRRCRAEFSSVQPCCRSHV